MNALFPKKNSKFMPLEENGTEFSTKSGQHAVTYFGCYIVLLKFLPDSRTVSC